MEQRGISKLDLKRQNRLQILRVVHENGAISRVDIASQLQLTRAAVTIITNEMISEGVLQELGEAPMGFDRAEKLLGEAPKLDFVIGSVHMAGEKFKHFDLYYIEKNSETYYHRVIDSYLEDVLRLARWGRFSVLGHLTLPLRYMNENLGEQMTFDGHYDQCREIFRALIESGCGIECNTNRGNVPLPDAPLLKLYRETGGEIITIGSDAHSAEYVGCCVRETQALLRTCGFRYFCTFEGGKPTFRKL